MPKRSPMKSPIKVQGVVKIKLWDGHGFSEERVSHNLVTDAGLDVIARMVSGQAAEEDLLALIAIGSGGHAEGDPTLPLPPAPDDAALEAELARYPIDSFSAPGGGLSIMRVTFDKEVAVGDITEAGLFTEGGTLVSRVTFPAYTKTALLYLSVLWQYGFTNEED